MFISHLSSHTKTEYFEVWVSLRKFIYYVETLYYYLFDTKYDRLVNMKWTKNYILTRYVINGIKIKPKPPMYADVPMPIPRNSVGYSSPAKGYIIRKDADIADFEIRYNVKVAVSFSEIKNTL